MYYYIMEPAGRKTAVWQEKIKDILGDLGIAGETVMPSSARTIEELASLGVVKGYSTIVAVGSEKIANKVASAIINHKDNKDTVLGVVPDNFNSAIAQKIGVKDVKEACEALKFRKLQTVDACLVEPNKYFLTFATIENPRTFEIYLTLDTVKAGLPCHKITIKPGLKIIIDDFAQTRPAAKKIFGWLFGKKEEKDIYSSFFHSQKIRIDVIGKTLPVKADDEIIAKTPIICHNRPRALKLIVGRDTIKTRE